MGYCPIHYHWVRNTIMISDNDKKLWAWYTQDVKPLHPNNNTNGETYDETRRVQTQSYERMGEDRLAKEGRETEISGRFQTKAFAVLSKLLRE